MTDKVLYLIDLKELLSSIRMIVSEELSKKETTSLEDKLLSTSEAVKIFVPSISKQTLHAWTKAGLLKMQRIGGKNYYMYSELIKSTTTLKKYKHHG